VIRYRNGVLNGRGASLLDGYMEDLATDRIYRLVIAQRIRHREVARIVDSDGKAVRHTPEFISELFDQELSRLILELAGDADDSVVEKYRQARLISQEMIEREQFDPH
jgi:malate synthase